MKKESGFERLINDFSNLPYIKKSLTLIESNLTRFSIKTLSGSLKALTISLLWLKTNRQIFILCPNKDVANNWLHDLSLLAGENNIAFLCEPQKMVKTIDDTIDKELLWLIDGISVLQNNGKCIAVATPEILNKEIPQPDEISDFRISLKKGDNIIYDNLTKDLALNGFDRKDFVAIPGDMAVRGGILDIFPPGMENPLRIEFWGDEIESIREFETLSQRSISYFDEISFIGHIFTDNNGQNNSTIIDYLENNCVFVIDEYESIIVENQDFVYPQNFFTIFINSLGEPDVKVISHPQMSFQSSVQKLAKELVKLYYSNYKLYLCAEGKIHIERFKELVENSLDFGEQLDEENLHYDVNPQLISKSINWFDQTLSNGFILEEYNYAFFTEHQIFNRLRIRDKSNFKKYSSGISLRELKQLNRGDFIVHSDKGIGKFEGFETIKLGGSLQDCVKLIFAEGDVLYVNLNYIHKIQKYSAQEGVEPKLTKLGTSEWSRKKERTKKRLKDIARDLIKLYSIRKSQKGYDFPADTLWQKEFEASFIYEDTPDQAKTTEEVKKDMESTSPMDRLVCGDVGFGKTEIAIRAAFKAAQVGKQVAILVPTTILAQQHYMTFIDRLSRYPVIVEVNSRFKTTAEQKKILEKTQQGKIDILIGTHRILSKDVVFKDLGLLIIDEEHRFGVAAKEKLRQIKTNVDTLTLTATPIPRTLNFSLMGARDLSVIETSPKNRVPIYTEVMIWNQDIIAKAITKELERGGQVFFVNDKIMDLEKITLDLKMLMPNVKFGIAHGQMKSNELESIMEKFVQKKYDVLVTTKIVESGLDIPNANTIIINQAHHFGLAELYQLRGRVGRSNTQAYCYLLIPPIKTLATNSIKRLQAIEEFTELGSRVQLAMRDLEIRGAGNLLGAEQSGFINEIGFELFHKILDEAVYELRTEEFSDIFKDNTIPVKEIVKDDEIVIDINKEALIPSDFVKNETERFHFYKMLYNARTNQELTEIVDELKDRFGRLPEKAQNLIYAVKLRVAALSTGFTKIILKDNLLTLEFPNEKNTYYWDNIFQYVVDLINNYENAQLVQTSKGLNLDMNVQNIDEAIEFLWRIKMTVQAIL